MFWVARMSFQVCCFGRPQLEGTGKNIIKQEISDVDLVSNDLIFLYLLNNKDLQKRKVYLLVGWLTTGQGIVDGELWEVG